MFVFILLIFFFVCIAIQVAYAAYFFVRIYDVDKQRYDINAKEPVSVIICAKNEARNLEQYLPQILAQRYTNADGISMFEVVVVDDASDDDTQSVLAGFSQHENLKIVTVGKDAERTYPGKKYALSRALKVAAHDKLVMIDADCRPVSDEWLAHMAAPLNAGKAIVAGYGKMKHRGGLLNTFIRWETLHTFLQYSTYALAGKPYMAVGRNIGYTRFAIEMAQQSDVWFATPSGDDDLLVRTVGNATNTAIVCHPKAFTASPAKATWQEWFVQKQRHFSTGKYYKDEIQFLLGVYGISHTLMWLLFFGLLFSWAWIAVLVVMGLRCILYWVLWGAAARRLHEDDLTIFFPLFDIGWMVYNFAFAPYIIWKNRTRWK